VATPEGTFLQKRKGECSCAVKEREGDLKGGKKNSFDGKKRKGHIAITEKERMA